MKANETLEKLYLLPNGLISYCRNTDEDIEYTCTDAFIEKAAEWLKENKDKYLYNTGEKGEYISACSSKIVDEFRNYMKGE